MNVWKWAAIFAALLVGVPASGQGAGSESKTGSAAGSSAQGGKALSKDLDKALQELHAANQSEVQLGEHAAQTATSSEVKQFAEMMQKDHQKNDTELETLAKTMGVNLTGDEFQSKQKDAQKNLDDLKARTGEEFDKDYMKLMVKDHQKDVKDVEKAAKQARKEKHTQLASFLETTHKSLQKHLTAAQRIEKTMGKGGGAKSSGAGAHGSMHGSGGAHGSAGTSGTHGSAGASGTTGTSGNTGASSTSGTESGGTTK